MNSLKWIGSLLFVCFALQARAQAGGADDHSMGAVTAEQRMLLDSLEQGVHLDGEATGASEKRRPRREYYTFDRLYEKYGSREDFTSILFGKRMMQMMSERIYDEDRELAKLLKEIRSIRILSTNRPTAEFEADARSWVETVHNVGTIAVIEEHGQTTYTYLVDGGKWNTSTFVLMSFGPSEQLMLHITGYFSVKDISRLAEIRPR